MLVHQTSGFFHAKYVKQLLHSCWQSRNFESRDQKE